MGTSCVRHVDAAKLSVLSHHRKGHVFIGIRTLFPTLSMKLCVLWLLDLLGLSYVCGLWFCPGTFEVCGLWFCPEGLVVCGLWIVVLSWRSCGLWFVVCGFVLKVLQTSRPPGQNHKPQTTRPPGQNHKPQTTNHKTFRTKPQTTNHKPQKFQDKTTNHKPQESQDKATNPTHKKVPEDPITTEHTQFHRQCQKQCSYPNKDMSFSMMAQNRMNIGYIDI